MSFRYSSCFSFSSPNMRSVSTSENPMMAFNGVRNSWDMLARNSDLCWLATSSWSQADKASGCPRCGPAHALYAVRELADAGRRLGLVLNTFRRLRHWQRAPPFMARLVGRDWTGGGGDGAPGLRPPTHAVRREGLACDLLHDRDGSTPPRARPAPDGSAGPGTRRSGRRGRR